MVDSIAVLPPGERILDVLGNPISGAQLQFFLAGTTTPLTVYSDSGLSVPLGVIVYCDAGGYPVTAQAGTTKTLIYTGTAPYKLIITDSIGAVQLALHDNIKGAINSAALIASITVIPRTAVTTLTADTILTANQEGKLWNCNCTGGAFSVTLPDALLTPNGAIFVIRHAGTANQVKIKTTSTQTISHAGQVSTAFALTQLGETVQLVCDGGNWEVDGYVPPLQGSTGVITITDQLTTPPGSPTPGARYIISGAPAGAWSSFSIGDIVESDGQSSWFRYTPTANCGWLAYIQTANILYQFQASAWVQLYSTTTQSGLIISASKANMKALTALRGVTADIQSQHPSHPKMWGYATISGGVPTLQTSFNVTSVTHPATGQLTVNITNAFSSANWACVAIGDDTDGRAMIVTARAAGSFTLAYKVVSQTSTEPLAYNFMGLGDQP